MRNKILYLSLLFLFSSPFLNAQNTGATPCDAIDLYQAAIGDCNNSAGAQLAGEYQCENAGCNNTAMPGTATMDGSCTPDNDIGQAAIWLSVTATADDIVIQNETNYAGGGGAEAEDRDYTIFSGPCGSLTEVGCAADIDDGSAATFTGLTVGDTYFIQVTQSQGAIAACAGCTTSSSCAQSSVPFSPTNNTCASATSMTDGVTVNGTNANATDVGAPSVCDGPASGSTENTIYFEWCAPVTWPIGDPAFVHVFNQTCNGSQGLQMSVYGASETCATLAASTSTSLVCENPGSTSDFFFQWPANPNDCYIIVLDGFAGTACNFDIQVNNSAILLPIELINFTATPNNRSVDLRWTTVSEINNDRFVIETSSDLKSWEVIGEIQGQGNSSVKIQYEFTDYSYYEDIHYYRLKQIDFDGGLTYSKIISNMNTSYNKVVVSRYDLLGRPISNNYTGFVIVIYDDGSKEKLYISNDFK